MRERLFLSRRYRSLLCVLNDCVDSISLFRLAVGRADKNAVLSEYKKFFEDYVLFYRG